MTRYRHIVTAAALVASLVSCGGGASDAAMTDDVVVKVGEAVLTLPELREKTPYGLSADDSVRFVNAYVRQWIDGQLVGEVAARNIPNNEAIDAKVEAYRKALIMMEYRRLMYEEHAPRGLSDDSLNAYYERHKENFKLSTPLVKGVFIRLPEGSPRLAEVRKWMKSGKSDDIDRLEKYHLSDSRNVEYDYFLDEWTDWDHVAERMPLGFKATPEMIMRNRYYETSSGGNVSMLVLAEMLPKGETAPFGTVRDNIREYIAGDMRVDYDRELKQHLYEEGIADGVIVVNMDLGLPEGTIKN